MKAGQYTNEKGEAINVIDFDADNKIALVRLDSGGQQWFPESDYSKWVSNNTAEMPKTYIPDIPAQIIEETKVKKPKKK